MGAPARGGDCETAVPTSKRAGSALFKKASVPRDGVQESADDCQAAVQRAEPHGHDAGDQHHQADVDQHPHSVLPDLRIPDHEEGRRVEDSVGAGGRGGQGRPSAPEDHLRLRPHRVPLPRIQGRDPQVERQRRGGAGPEQGPRCPNRRPVRLRAEQGRRAGGAGRWQRGGGVHGCGCGRRNGPVRIGVARCPGRCRVEG